MRKNVLGTAASRQPVQDHEWLDLEFIASVEVTTEDPSFPIDDAFALTGDKAGWRAGTAGEQKITILFDGPTLIHLVHLRFLESAMERTQEFTLRWSGVEGGSREIARQQWNFSPTGSTEEVENLQVNLAGVLSLELAIRPDIGGRPVLASLQLFRLA